MTIFINYDSPLSATPLILCYSDISQPYVSTVELKHWIAQQLGLCNQSYDINLYFCGEKCTDHDEIATKSCQLDAHVVQVYFEALLYDHTNKSNIIWCERHPTERSAAQHLFVWLVQNRYLQLDHVLDDLDAYDMNLDNHDNTDDTSEKETAIRRQLRAILQGELDEVAEIDTADDLWDWCHLIKPGFHKEWSFGINRTCKKI